MIRLYGKYAMCYGGMLILVKLQAEACNFTKFNTSPWVFFTLFKLYKCYQIAQRITYAPVLGCYKGGSPKKSIENLKLL